MPGKRGLQKVCHLKEDKLLIEMASEVRLEQMYQGEIDVGHFTAYQIYPTCGIATKDHIIGEVDDPRYFDDPERINAGILWFTKGFIEYRIPNYLKPWQKIVELQFSMELSSEAPGICEDWPSDIYFH
jgi:transcriptional regulator, ArsR family